MPPWQRVCGAVFSCPFSDGVWALRPFAGRGEGTRRDGGTEDLAGRLEERPQSGGLPPLAVPGHARADVKASVPRECREFARPQFAPHRDVRQHGET